MKKVLDKLSELMGNTKFDTNLTSDPNQNHELITNLIETALKEIPTKTIRITKYNTKKALGSQEAY